MTGSTANRFAFADALRAAPEAFLDAILAAPDDDAPRLIFADWLDDRGSPEHAAWAAFIRSQCALAALPAYDPERIEHEVRAAVLERDWAAPVKTAGALRGVRFERGLLVEAAIADHGFPHEAEELLRAHRSLAGIEVRYDERRAPHDRTLNERRLMELLEHPAAEHVSGLKFGAGLLDSEAFRVAAARLPRLKKIVIQGSVSDAGMRAIAASEMLPRLVELKIAKGVVYSESFLADLPLTPLGRRLERLSLRGVGLGMHPTAERWERFAAEAVFPQLKSLTLEGVYLPGGVSEALSGGRLLESIERLKMIRCGLADDDAARLTRGAQLARCTELVLRGNYLRAAGLASLAGSDSLKNLQRLDLSDTPSLGGAGVAALVENLRWPALKALDLSRVNLGDDGAEIIGWAPGLSPLVELILRGNAIGPAGAAGLARSLSHGPLARLQSLDLGRNPLGDGGASALAGAEPSSRLARLWRRFFGRGQPTHPADFTHLQRLALDDAQVGLRGALSLAVSRALKSLRDLDVQNNPIPGSGGEALISSTNFPRLLRLTLPRGTVTRIGV